MRQTFCSASTPLSISDLFDQDRGFSNSFFLVGTPAVCFFPVALLYFSFYPNGPWRSPRVFLTIRKVDPPPPGVLPFREILLKELGSPFNPLPFFFGEDFLSPSFFAFFFPNSFVAEEILRQFPLSFFWFISFSNNRPKSFDRFFSLFFPSFLF